MVYGIETIADVLAAIKLEEACAPVPITGRNLNIYSDLDTLFPQIGWNIMYKTRTANEYFRDIFKLGKNHLGIEKY